MTFRGTVPITYEERLKIESLMKQGILNCKAIAQVLGRHWKAIQIEIKRGGGRQFYTAEVAQARADKMKSNRVHLLKRKFSESEIEEIVTCRAKGHSIWAIARTIGCGESTMRRFLEEKKIKAPARGDVITLDDRVRALEVQITILEEEIKELKSK